ncbi:hypothetical protein GMOD_00001283 [Pyrenophora seminiperda CCB06]|uniref:Uncharacterized protein n=1 Tax=Pyrenophora seminiperda CCB06 TaxID=1302712 RepID=A0A3M7LYV3_9PLEO|nr:hypothetical protein GMOD_00001283 [Pyrenophora seminiperda CCB06]
MPLQSLCSSSGSAEGGRREFTAIRHGLLEIPGLAIVLGAIHGAKKQMGYGTDEAGDAVSALAATIAKSISVCFSVHLK